jgi:hypothetical protein
MPHPELFTGIRAMIEQFAARGQTPILFVMNGATMRLIAEDLAADRWKNLSALGKAWHRLKHHGEVPMLESLYGVPVHQDDHFADGTILIQRFGQIAPRAAPQGQQGAVQSSHAQPGPPAEMMVREKIAAPASDDGEVRPTLNDLSSGNGERPSSSDVIMRALDRVDDLTGVAVVRVYKNGDIDLCANIEKYALQGVLQHAIMWVVQH